MGSDGVPDAACTAPRKLEKKASGTVTGRFASAKGD